MGRVSATSEMTQPAQPSSAPAKEKASLLPGLALCAAGAVLAVLANRAVPTISALLFAIILGAVLANLVELPQRLAPGIAFSSKKVLRAGIVLLGLQLVLGDILGLGYGMVAVVVAVVTLGILGTLLIGRALGIEPAQRLLVACGFSICGAAAVAAADGVISPKKEETATAVALVVLFGTLMIPVVPLLAGLMGMPERVAGLWAGASIHEVAQVVAAGGTLGNEALQVAVIVKLARVVMLAPVMAVLAWQVRRRLPAGSTIKRPPLVPLFVVGFLAMMAVASLHLLDQHTLAQIKLVQTALLAAAMFALGLGVKVRTLVKVGPKPFVLGLASTVLVALIAFVGVWLTNWQM